MMNQKNHGYSTSNSDLQRKQQSASNTDRHFPSFTPLPLPSLPKRDLPSPLVFRSKMAPVSTQRTSLLSGLQSDVKIRTNELVYDSSILRTPKIENYSDQPIDREVYSGKRKHSSFGKDENQSLESQNFTTGIFEEPVIRNKINHNPFSTQSFDEKETRFGQTGVIEGNVLAFKPAPIITGSPVVSAQIPNYTEEINALRKITRENTENLRQLTSTLNTIAAQNKSTNEAIMIIKQEVDKLRFQPFVTPSSKPIEAATAMPQNNIGALDSGLSTEAIEFQKMKDQVDAKTRKIAELQENVALLTQNLKMKNNLDVQDQNKNINQGFAVVNMNQKISETSKDNYFLNDEKSKPDRGFFNEWIQIIHAKEDQLEKYRNQLNIATKQKEETMHALRNLTEQNIKLKEANSREETRTEREYIDRPPPNYNPRYSMRSLSTQPTLTEQRPVSLTSPNFGQGYQEAKGLPSFNQPQRMNEHRDYSLSPLVKNRTYNYSQPDPPRVFQAQEAPFVIRTNLQTPSQPYMTAVQSQNQKTVQPVYAQYEKENFVQTSSPVQNPYQQSFPGNIEEYGRATTEANYRVQQTRPIPSSKDMGYAPQQTSSSGYYSQQNYNTSPHGLIAGQVRTDPNPSIIRNRYESTGFDKQISERGVSLPSYRGIGNGGSNQRIIVGEPVVASVERLPIRLVNESVSPVITNRSSSLMSSRRVIA